MQTYIPGIQSLDSLEFTTNYNLEDFKKLKALDGKEYDYAVWFGGTEDSFGNTLTPTGADGRFSFKGQLSVFPVGTGTNEVVEMTITIAPSTPITFDGTSGAETAAAISPVAGKGTADNARVQ